MAFSLNNTFQWIGHRAGEALQWAQDRTEDAIDGANLHSAMFELKSEALRLAKEQSQEAGQDKFTLDDYRDQFLKLAQSSPLFSEADRKNPDKLNQIAADLGGQTLDGVMISEAKNHPAVAFYDHLNFKDAVITHSIVDPAASFNTHIKDARKMEDVTFRNMNTGDNFMLGQGHYHHLKVENCKGGNFVFAGSHVDDLDIHDATITNFSMTHDAKINHLNADHAHFLEINAEPGTAIANSHFIGATIAPSGHMQGIRLINTDFSGASMEDVNLSGAQLAGVTLPSPTEKTKMPLKGVNFTGATLTNVKLDDGTPVTSPDQLAALGATVDKTYIKGVSAQAAPTEEHPLAKLAAGVTLPKVEGGQDVQAAQLGELNRGTDAKTQSPQGQQPPAKNDTMSLQLYYASMGKAPDAKTPPTTKA